MSISEAIVNRREFLLASGVAALTAGDVLYAKTTPSPINPGSRTPKPNIMVIITDQQCAGALSCAGNVDLKTPAMDRLAETGVRFEKAYCTNPLCVPSRTVMMTGKMPHETRITNNLDPTESRLQAPMLGRIFADAGYDCGYAGKWHLPVKESQVDVHGFGWYLNGTPRCPDAKIPETVAEFLRRKRDRPFLMVASFLNPHDICQWARGDKLPQGPLPDPPPAEKCPSLPDNFAIPDHEPDIIRKIQHASKSTYPSVDWTPEKWRQYRWAYYRLVERVDAQIGELMEVLDYAGVLDDTLVVFTADHGDGNASHHWNQKQVLYEEPTRVPFIVSNSKITHAGRLDRDHLVSTGIDLIPTLCDYAGIAAPKALRGLSVKPIVSGTAPDRWRDFVVCETEFDYDKTATGIYGRMLRLSRYKYIVYSEGTLREQLFDLESDPGEMKNLALDSGAKDILADCRAKLTQWARDTDDTFSIP